ncbi:hypothetical protein [Micromonospora sp. NPDC048839]|uniref:hypothetical protein n=1 Tax=Micromonospora sp. NPDC048839 TaxID=3155641 RepID=UPI0033EC0668
MIPSDQLPPGPDWIARRLADLDRQVRELLAGRQPPATPLAWVASDSTLWPGTTSSAFVSLLEASVPRQQPRITVRIRHTTELAGTFGELRVMANGQPLDSTVAVTFGAATTTIGPVALPSGTYAAVVGLTVDARRTAGSGSVRAMVAGAWTQQ